MKNLDDNTNNQNNNNSENNYTFQNAVDEYDFHNKEIKLIPGLIFVFLSVIQYLGFFIPVLGTSTKINIYKEPYVINISVVQVKNPFSQKNTPSEPDLDIELFKLDDGLYIRGVKYIPNDYYSSSSIRSITVNRDNIEISSQKYPTVYIKTEGLKENIIYELENILTKHIEKTTVEEWNKDLIDFANKYDIKILSSD